MHQVHVHLSYILLNVTVQLFIASKYWTIFPAEFEYEDVFRLWETWWAAGQCYSAHFLEFCGLAIMTQFKWVVSEVQ